MAPQQAEGDKSRSDDLGNSKVKDAQVKSDGNAANAETDLPTGAWMIRPCHIYRAEYEDCASWHGRAFQRYTTGSDVDCSDWLNDWTACTEYQKTKDSSLLPPIIEREKGRRARRLSAARGNDVWEYRKDPGKDWQAGPVQGFRPNREFVEYEEKVRREKGEGHPQSTSAKDPVRPRWCSIM